ncbi:MAG: FAD-dependent oxidoreductase [Longimicrobiales bacterium]
MATNSSSRRLTIVGGGPAGLVAGIAAQRAGFQCTVYEQAANFTRVGGALGIQSNGLRVLEALELLEPFRNHYLHLNTAVLESPPGRLLTRADFSDVRMPQSGFGVALRYDLQELLADRALESGVDIRFGMRCSRAEWLPHAVNLHFADGSTVEAPLILACDGSNSVVRESLGFKAQKRVLNEAYLRLVAPIEHPAPDRAGEYWAADGRRAGAFPLPRRRTYVFCSVPVGGWQDILRGDIARWVKSWEDFGEPVSTLMHSIQDWSGAVYDQLSDLRVERWQRNGVFLLGDAAHAMTPNLGQGANSAMVDALVLVNLLAESAANRSWRDAGRRYEQLRRPFVTRLQNAALLGGRCAAWRNPLARAVRDTFIQVTTRIPTVHRSSLMLTGGYNPLEQPFLRAPVRVLVS